MICRDHVLFQLVIKPQNRPRKTFTSPIQTQTTDMASSDRYSLDCWSTIFSRSLSPTSFASLNNGLRFQSGGHRLGRTGAPQRSSLDIQMFLSPRASREYASGSNLVDAIPSGTASPSDTTSNQLWGRATNMLEDLVKATRSKLPRNSSGQVQIHHSQASNMGLKTHLEHLHSSFSLLDGILDNPSSALYTNSDSRSPTGVSIQRMEDSQATRHTEAKRPSVIAQNPWPSQDALYMAIGTGEHTMNKLWTGLRNVVPVALSVPIHTAGPASNEKEIFATENSSIPLDTSRVPSSSL